MSKSVDGAPNLRTDPSCSFCGYAQGTFAHQWYACPGMVPIASRREHAPILFPFTSLPGILMKPTHPCSGPLESQACPNHRYLSLGAQEVTDWEAQDDTWEGHHRRGRIEVAGPYFLDGSAFNPEIVELRRAGWGFAVLEHPEPSTLTVVPVAPPCLSLMTMLRKEEWLEDQMQEILEITPRRSGNDRRARPESPN